MSTAPDHILEDEHIRKKIREVTEAEGLLKRMNNELEIEQVGGKLVLSELERSVLRVEGLFDKALHEENARLKKLIVDQINEINKSSVLVSTHDELLKQREALFEWIRNLPSPVDCEKMRIDEVMPEDCEEHLPQVLIAPASDEDQSKVNENASRTGESALEIEKEPINLKITEAQRHELLDELQILEEFTNENEEPQGAESHVEQQSNFPDRRFWVEGNHEESFKKRPYLNPTDEASSMQNERQHFKIASQCMVKGTQPETTKRSAFVMKKAKLMNRIGSSSEGT